MFEGDARTRKSCRTIDVSLRIKQMQKLAPAAGTLDLAGEMAGAPRAAKVECTCR